MNEKKSFKMRNEKEIAIVISNILIIDEITKVEIKS